MPRSPVDVEIELIEFLLEGDNMTSYRDRLEAGEYDAPKPKKAKVEEPKTEEKAPEPKATAAKKSL